VEVCIRHRGIYMGEKRRRERGCGGWVGMRWRELAKEKIGRRKKTRRAPRANH
jgi:hypothetical protein